MSMPKIPDFTSDLSVDREEAVIMLLSSIAEEEMALSRIIHAQADSLSHFFDTRTDEGGRPFTYDDMMKINDSVVSMMNDIMTKEIILKMKLAKVIELAQRQLVTR